MAIGKKKRFQMLKFMDPFKILVRRSVSDLRMIKRDITDESCYLKYNGEKDIDILFSEIESRMLNHYEQMFYKKTSEDDTFKKLDNYYILDKEEEPISQTLTNYSDPDYETEYVDYIPEFSSIKNNEIVDNILRDEFSLTEDEIYNINKEAGYSFEYDSSDPYSTWRHYCFILDMNKVFDCVKELKNINTNKLGI